MLNWLNIDTVQGVLRAVLAFGGGILVGKGTLTNDQLLTLTQKVCDPTFLGALAGIITAVWSVIHKQQTAATVTSTTTTAVSAVATK